MKNKKNKQDEVMVIDFDHNREAVLNDESWVYTDSLNIANTMNVENTEVNRKIRQILNEYNLEVNGETPCTENMVLKHGKYDKLIQKTSQKIKTINHLEILDLG